MADTNQDTKQATEALARLRLALDESSFAVDKRTDQEMKAKYGVENFSKGTAKAAGALGALGGAAMSSASAMLKGEKGAAAFNGSVDGMASAAKMAGAALSLMIPGGPLIKVLIAGLTAAVTAVAEFTKAANTMGDQLHKGYSGLAKSGAAASDGMTGLFKDAKKLGMSMGELDGYVQMIGENSRDLALFSGSVSDGRKRFAEIGKEMEPFRAGLLNMGIDMEAQREGTMGYIRLQTRMGMSQNKTTEELAEGARRYLMEQDALSRITGQTRKEMQVASERALQQQQFASKIRQLEMQDRHDEAQAMKNLNAVYTAAGDDVAAAYQASVTGNFANADAIAFNIASQNELMRTSDLVAKGKMSEMEAAQITLKAIGRFNDAVNLPLASVNAGMINFQSGERARLLAQGDLTENLKKQKIDQEAAMAGADPLVQAQTDLRLSTIAANEATEEFIFTGIVPAIAAMIAIANTTAAAARSMTPGDSPVSRYGNEEFHGLLEGLEPRQHGSLGATGKLIEDFGTGTPMMLHGREGVVTEAQLNSLIQAATGSAPGAARRSTPNQNFDQPDSANASTDTNQAMHLQNLQQEMLKDTESLAKITDSDVRRAREFSRINLRLTDLKTQLMEDEIEVLEEQNQMLADIEEIYSKTMGPEAAKAAVKAFKRTQILSNAAVPAAGGGGSASAAPGAQVESGGPSAPSEVEGAQGSGPAAKAADVLDFTARSGSASAFEGLNSRLKDSVIAAAEEYHAATGGKFQINSAKRDPADQKRLYDESVALGTPGRGPTGMAVAKPGRSPHEKGLAVDIQNYNDSAAVAAMNRQGLSQKVPGDPVHFSFGDGGIANGPGTGYLAELHGPEAVVPLPDGKTIPVRIEGDMPGNSGSADMSAMMNQFRTSMESMVNQLNNRDLLNMMDEMVRTQKASNSIQEKLLRAAAS